MEDSGSHEITEGGATAKVAPVDEVRGATATVAPASPAKASGSPNKPKSPSKAIVAVPAKSTKQREIPPNPEGFHKNVITHIGDDDVLAKIKTKMLDGEEIMDSFNVFFLDGAMAMIDIYFLMIFTCGFAIFYFAYRAFLRALYRRKIIRPSKVGFKRSIMVITSFGRVLVWAVEAEQRKENDMVQYNRQPWLWSSDWKTWVKAAVDFFKLITLNYKLIGMVETCAPPMSYSMSTLMAVYHLKDLRQLSVLSQSTSPCGGLLRCCPIFTSQIAICFTGATDADIESDFSSLNAGVRTVTDWSKSINDMLNGDGDDYSGGEKGIFGQSLSPDIIYIDITTNKFDKVHEGAGTVIVEELSNLATQILAHNRTLRPVFRGDSVGDGIVVHEKDATIVHNNGTVTVPAPYFPMLRGERILEVHGQVFRPKFIEWIYTLASLGIYYFTNIRPKRYNRTAFLITTHRIAEIIISQREGCVPSHGANYSFGSRSFFPRRIDQKGFISRSRNRVTGGIMMSFDMFGRRDVFEQFLKFYSFFQDCEGQSPMYVMKPPEKEVKLSGVEASVIKLQPGEFVVGRFQGTNNWRPFPCFEKCCNTHVCCEPCYPWIPWLLSCSLRPKRQYSSIIITTKSVYFMSAITNFTCNFMALRDSFALTYAPLGDFVGVQTSVKSTGREWCLRRMWQWVCCCNFCRAMLPIAKHVYEMKGSVSSGVHVLVGGGPMAFHPVEDINAFDMVVAKVQKAIWDATPDMHESPLPVQTV